MARWQASAVADALRAARPGCSPELIVVETVGDRRLDLPVWELGGQGVFVKEVQAAVLDGRADLAVHSAKDLPSSPGLVDAGLELAAFLPRADPRDALVGAPLSDLAPGAVIATGSVRRRAQLAWLRPDLTFAGLRGNIATRLEHVPPGGAAVVAAAALSRLGLLDRAAQILGPSQMLPQVGQGAIAVECRAGDDRVLTALAAIDAFETRVAVTAERAFLARLGGGCDLPVGAYARLVGPDGSDAGGGDHRLMVEGLLASLDGRVVLRRVVTGPVVAASDLGGALAQLLLDNGGSDLLDAGPRMAPAPGTPA